MSSENNGKKSVRTCCPLSKSRCGIICEVQDGKLVRVRKDPDHPNCADLCPKGIAAPELVYHPERLKYPLKRITPKTAADPGWERISRDEALEELGIGEGEWVIVETTEGSIRVRDRLHDGIAPNVVSAQHGWWQGCTELGLPAYNPLDGTGANVNLLVPNNLRDEISGSVPHKSYPCNIRKVVP